MTVRKVSTNNLPYNTSDSYSAVVSSLSPATTYYYQAFMTVSDGNGGHTEIVSAVGSFTTLPQGQSPQLGYMELPAKSAGSGFSDGTFGSGTSRNYSYHYDTNRYTALWTAYPLTTTHISGTANTEIWNYNPNIDQNIQINVVNNSYGVNYGDDTYSRGHQIPAADRKCSNDMRAQTYYVTNQTPQIQNGFNSTVWSNLEGAVRALPSSSADTVYVVTGAAFRKSGGSETINELQAKSGIKPTTIYIPNYYWKVLLKVRWEGSGADRHVAAASAIGIWMDHQTYSSNDAWRSHTKTVQQIQDWTGFDFFVNLPDGAEAAAETNSDWTTFVNFH